MSQPSAVVSASFARSSPRCQLWTSLPRFPSGFSRLWSGPATKPSSEIDMWQVVSDIARSRQQGPYLLAVVAVMRRRVMLAQRFLARPRGEQHKLSRVIAGKNTKADATRLAVCAVRQCAQRRVQLSDEGSTPMH